MSEAAPDVSKRRIAAMVAVIGTVIATALHVTFTMKAGGLWRDEVSSLNLATMRSFSELWSYLPFDSFPALFFILLRAFAGVPVAVSDMDLRVFGGAIGLLVIVALWLNARWLRFGFPLISLALIGFNPMVIRYGDSIRAYGLGMLLLLVSLGTMWRLVEKVNVGRVLVALISAVLSVQCLYYNSFLLFAISAGAIAVCCRRRTYRRILIILGIGGVAAASMLVYLPTIRKVGETQFLWKVNFTPAMFWYKLSEALGSPLPGFVWLWLALFAVAIAAAAWCLCRARIEDSRIGSDTLLFGLVTLLVGSGAYFGFLFRLSYATQPWYYVVFVAFAATCLEIIFASLPSKQWALRSAFAIVCIGLMTQPAWSALQFRQTNVDAIANRLESVAAPDDLILINTWSFGITFRHYYHGMASCATLPPIADLRFHRMDLLYRQLVAPAPIAPLLHKMEETLRHGHTIWLIGGLNLPAPGQAPLSQRPPADVERGVREFDRAWSEQAGLLVQRHADEFERVPVPLRQPVLHYENLPLTAIRGWHESGGFSLR